MYHPHEPGHQPITSAYPKIYTPFIISPHLPLVHRGRSRTSWEPLIRHWRIILCQLPGTFRPRGFISRTSPSSSHMCCSVCCCSSSSVLTHPSQSPTYCSNYLECDLWRCVFPCSRGPPLPPSSRGHTTTPAVTSDSSAARQAGETLLSVSHRERDEPGWFTSSPLIKQLCICTLLNFFSYEHVAWWEKLIICFVGRILESGIEEQSEE